MPLIRQLTEHQRLSVIAALVVLVTTGLLLVFFTRAAARITRWYMNRPARSCYPPGRWLTGRTDHHSRPESLDEDPWGTEA